MYQSIPDTEDVTNGGSRKTSSTCRKWMTNNVMVLLVATALVAISAGVLIGQFSPGRIEHLIRGDNESKPKYARVQTLSLDLYTGPAPAFLGKNVSNPECHKKETQGTIYQGHKHPKPACYMGMTDLVDDVDRRITIIQDAVNTAYEMSEKDEDVLKVFLVPEFYFRGPYGAYEVDTTPIKNGEFDPFTPITRIRQSLEKIVEQAKFKDWFFVFGTVVGVDRNFSPIDSDEKRQYINVALMYKGFDPAVSSPKGHRFLAPKTYVSKIDFLSPTRDRGSTITSDPDDFGHDLFDSREMLTEVWDRIQAVQYEVVKHHWFEVDGILISIEICLDHRMGMAIRSYLNYALQNKEIPIADTDKSKITYGKMTKLAQLSLIVSAGMTIQAQNLALRKGGLVFIADGDDGEDEAWKRVPGTEDFLSEYNHYDTFPNEAYPWGKTKPYFNENVTGVFSEEMTPPRVLDYGTFDIPP